MPTTIMELIQVMTLQPATARRRALEGTMKTILMLLLGFDWEVRGFDYFNDGMLQLLEELSSGDGAKEGSAAFCDVFLQSTFHDPYIPLFSM